MNDDLVRRARAVLDRNRAGAYTCPSVRLYPHQWLWDSCFTAIGIPRFDASRAADELRALFRGQWDNGMLPHMIFADGSRDIGSRRVWKSQTRAGAPRDVATTCITQPPLVAIALEDISEIQRLAESSKSDYDLAVRREKNLQAQVAEAIRQQAGISEEQVDAEYGANPAPRGPLNWAWVQAMLRAIDKHGGGVNQQTLELFYKIGIMDEEFGDSWGRAAAEAGAPRPTGTAPQEGATS